jgi:hypothetical protein
MSADISSLPDRVRRKISTDENGCWIWSGASVGGYGRQRVGSRTDGTRREMYAHRFVYELLVGAVPLGLCLDHICRVRKCVNPAHLEPVTNGENCRRGVSSELTKQRHADITHCPNGHPRTPENLSVGVQKNGIHVHRKCKVCMRIRAVKYRTPRVQPTDER